MENLHNYTSEELAKCPYHAQLSQVQNNNEDREDTSTEINERDEAGTDPDRNENGNINNSGGA